MSERRDSLRMMITPERLREKSASDPDACVEVRGAGRVNAGNGYSLNEVGYVLALEAAARAEKAFGLEPIAEAIAAYLEFSDGGGCTCDPWRSFTCERHSK